MSELLALAEAVSAVKPEDATLRFSEAIVQGKRGYRWGHVATTSPEVMRILCHLWNNRDVIAAALKARAGSGVEG